MKKRALEVARTVAIALALGVAYYVFYRLTGIGIKCPTNLALGILCPTCGISRMLLALSQLDIASAAYYNAAVLVLLPVWTAALISYTVEYIKSGSKTPKKWHRAVFAASVALLVAYGVARNVWHIGLHPSNNEDYEFVKAIFIWRKI